jgi:Recombinase
VWSKSSVLSVLRYEGYTGPAYYGKWRARTATRRTLRPREEWVEFTIPQIIEIELFEATHGQLRRNQARATRNGKVPYLLGGGRLCCIRCSSTMTGYRLKSGSRRYKCAGMTRIDVSERCYATTKAEPLEDLVWAVVKRMLENPKLVAAEVGLKHASNDEKRAELQMEIEARDRALAECNRQEKRLLEVYVADEAMELKDLLGAHHREINTRRQQLRTEQRDLRQQLDDLHQDDARADALVVFCERVRKKLHTFTFEEKRQALDEFNLQAIWGAGEKLKIRVDVPKQVLQQLGDDVFADIALRWNGTCNN